MWKQLSFTGYHTIQKWFSVRKSWISPADAYVMAHVLDPLLSCTATHYEAQEMLHVRGTWNFTARNENYYFTKPPKTYIGLFNEVVRFELLKAVDVACFFTQAEGSGFGIHRNMCTCASTTVRFNSFPISPVTKTGFAFHSFFFLWRMDRRQKVFSGFRGERKGKSALEKEESLAGSSTCFNRKMLND